MATKAMRICDVTGSTKDVKACRLVLLDVSNGEDESHSMKESDVDLCPRAIERLWNFALRGCRPPTPKGGAK